MSGPDGSFELPPHVPGVLTVAVSHPSPQEMQFDLKVGVQKHELHLGAPSE
jgi:hypothetical protein